MVDDRRAGAMQAHEDFDVEIHALSDATASIEQRRDRRHRIDTQPAHGIVDVERQRLDPHADMRDPASHDAPQGRRVVIGRLADDDRVGMLPRQGQHVGDGRHVVLAVGVDLHAVAESCSASEGKAFEDGPALAAIDLEAAHLHAALRGVQRGQRRLGRCGAAVVDHEYRQPQRSQPFDDRRHRLPVIVARDDGADANVRRRHGPPAETVPEAYTVSRYR